MSQAFNTRFGWRLCGVLTVAALIFASLLLPSQLEQMRTGHWEIEHFFAYLVAVPLICLGWPRPFVVASTLIPVAALLEALQCLRPDHSPNIFARTQQHRGRGGRHPAYSSNNQAIGVTSRKTKKPPPQRRAECSSGNLECPHRLVSKRQLKITICRGRRQLAHMLRKMDWCIVVRKSNTWREGDIVISFNDRFEGATHRTTRRDCSDGPYPGDVAAGQMDTAHRAWLGRRALYYLLRHDN